jgi:CIC family chloride channel protein
MIFELTRDYTIIVPLMISNLIAFFISYRFQREPIYEALARQDGIHLPTAASRDGGGRRRVGEVLRASSVVLAATATVEEARARIDGRSMAAWPAVDDDGFVGMVPAAALSAAAARGDLARPIRELIDAVAGGHDAGEGFPHLHPDHGLGLALERMGTSKRNVLPVVSRADVRRLLGVVTLEDVLTGYGLDADGGGDG